MTKKYEILTDETITVGDVKLYRIKAIKDFGDIKAGDIGGFIQNESNLSHDGLAWVDDEAKVFGNAHVKDNALVYGKALVFGNAQVYGNAMVYGKARVFIAAQVYGDAQVFGNARVSNDAQVKGNANVSANEWVTYDRED